MALTKPLMGVVLFTHSKDYVYPKWLEMYKACCEGLVDVIFISEREIDGFKTIITPVPGHTSEDMLIVARDIIRCYAIDNDYESMIWQGIDCFYQSRQDFTRLIGQTGPYRAVGALTSARMDSSYAICRRFVKDKDGKPTTKQEDWEDTVLLDAVKYDKIISAYGFVGADALIIHRTLFAYNWDGHLPWYQRISLGWDNVCAEEEWCRRVLIDHPDALLLDASIRTWHVHDDGIAKMWPGINRPQEQLNWD